MVISPPKEILELRKIFKPYMEGCHFIEDTPQYALDAWEKYDEWYENIQGDWQ